MSKIFLFVIFLCSAMLTACSSAPIKPAQKKWQKPTPVVIKKSEPRTEKVNPISRLPPQTLPVPELSKRPAFGSDEFNRIKDVGPDDAPDVSNIPDAEPIDEPLAKYGNKTPYTVLGETYRLLPTSKGFTQTGTASWYGKKFHGMKTSSGETYDMYAMSAAHRNLPLPTYVRVTNLANNKTVIVKVNDRGPFHSDRVMDLSFAAATRLDIIKTGTGKVQIEAIDTAEFQRKLGSTGKPKPPVKTDLPSEEARFYVQVGAFGEISNATALQARLLDLIYAPVIIARADSTHSVNRVQVGPFFNREDAEKVATIIRDRDLGEPMVLKK